MLLSIAAVVFIILVVMGTPIVFAMILSGVAGLLAGGFDLTKLPSSMVAGADSFVLLAVPSFIFAGTLMERCNMSNQLVDLARATVGWMRGGLGMTTVAAEYLFSGVSGSSIADVSAIGAMLTPPMVKAGYKKEHAVSIVASATGIGTLVPPAIFMILVGTMTSTSVVGIFLGGFIPALAMSAVLMVTIYWLAVRMNWPTDKFSGCGAWFVSLKGALIPLFVPIFMLIGFRYGIFTATEAGAIIAAYSILVAMFLYRNVGLKEIGKIAEESALSTAAVILLLGAATSYQFLIGTARVPQAIGQVLAPLATTPWAFLIVVSLIVTVFGMVMEGPPAAVILVPVLFPISQQMGIHPIHFNIVLTAAAGVAIFMPPLGIGLLIALRYGQVSVIHHMRYYWPYVIAMALGLLLVILVPDITLWLPRASGFK